MLSNAVLNAVVTEYAEMTEDSREACHSLVAQILKSSLAEVGRGIAVNRLYRTHSGNL